MQTNPKHPGSNKSCHRLASGDILFLYTDGLYDGSGEGEKCRLQEIVRNTAQQSAKDICDALLGYAVERDKALRKAGRSDEIDDKTVFIVKRI